MSNIQETQVTFKSNKAGRSMDIAFGDLPESSQAAIIRYGAQRFINDKLGGSELGPEEAAEKFDQILLQLREGWEDRRGSGTGSGPVHPIEKEAHKLAAARVKAAIKARGIALKQVDKEKLRTLTEQMFEKHQKELMEKATQIVAAQQTKLEIDDIDLGSLEL